MVKGLEEGSSRGIFEFRKGDTFCLVQVVFIGSLCWGPVSPGGVGVPARVLVVHA